MYFDKDFFFPFSYTVGGDLTILISLLFHPWCISPPRSPRPPRRSPTVMPATRSTSQQSFPAAAMIRNLSAPSPPPASTLQPPSCSPAFSLRDTTLLILPDKNDQHSVQFYNSWSNLPEVKSFDFHSNQKERKARQVSRAPVSNEKTEAQICSGSCS